MMNKSPVILSPTEEWQLVTRGFYVKDWRNYWDFLKNILGWLILYLIASSLALVPLAFTGFITSLFLTAYFAENTYIILQFLLIGEGILWFVFSLALLHYSWYFIMWEKIFFLKNEVIWFQNLKKSHFFQEDKYLSTLKNTFYNFADYVDPTWNVNAFSIYGVIWTFIVLGLMILGILLFLTIPIHQYFPYLFLGWAPIPFIFLIRNFHPLYAFGNLWSKIQSLTPRISEESKKIETEFSTDMNFRTLSDSFDTLASDFNQIINYVIKLEYIEKKANKWNLFDSTKYINSLREDIRNPLISLRSFLEKKKIELQSSEQEMKKVRVKVGWSWNWETENLELQSKRTEPLIQELTENIEKLDRMIEKF